MIKGFSRTAWVAIAGLLALSLLAAACGGDDDAPTVDNTPIPTEVPTEVSVAAYPVDVVDLLGRTVTIEARPQAVIAISPTATEFVYAAGGTIIGRSSSVDFPAAAAGAQDVGTAYQPSFDQILALNPDLIVADSAIHVQPQLKDALEGLGVPVIFAGATSLDDVYAGLNLMGLVFDSSDDTDAVIVEIKTALKDAKAALAATDATFLALIADRDNNLYAAKPSGYTGDIFAQLGVTNPAADQPDSGPFPGYTLLAMELILQFDPTVLFAITPAPEPAPRLSALIPQIPPFAGLTAVQEGRVVELDVQLFLQAPGPRIGEAFAAVAEAMSGE
jgi:ABC-type Fe3+-hydroxamate transport system substrate-binding protein